MKIILMENVPKVGKAGEVLEVKDGFGRNYLIPKKLAIAATKKSLDQLEHHRKIIQVKANYVEIEWIDAFDDSPIIDIKPYIPRNDSFPQAKTPVWVG